MKDKKKEADEVPGVNTTGAKAVMDEIRREARQGVYPLKREKPISEPKEEKRGMSVVENYEKIEKSKENKYDAELWAIPEKDRKLLTKGSKKILINPPKSEERTSQQIFDQGKKDYQDCPPEKRELLVDQYIRLKNFPEYYKEYFGGLGIEAFQEALKHPGEIKPLLKAALLFRKSEIYHPEVEQSLRQILNEKREKMSEDEITAMKLLLRNYNPNKINDRYSKIRADLYFLLEQNHPGIEKKFLLVFAGISFFGSLLFLSSKFTGFAVSNTSNNNLSIIGGLLFLISLIAFLFYKRKRDKD